MHIKWKIKVKVKLATLTCSMSIYFLGNDLVNETPIIWLLKLSCHWSFLIDAAE